MATVLKNNARQNHQPIVAPPPPRCHHAIDSGYAAGPAQSPRHKYLFQINSGIQRSAEITVALATKYGENNDLSKGL
jgi:hypothetical protein